MALRSRLKGRQWKIKISAFTFWQVPQYTLNIAGCFECIKSCMFQLISIDHSNHSFMFATSMIPLYYVGPFTTVFITDSIIISLYSTMSSTMSVALHGHNQIHVHRVPDNMEMWILIFGHEHGPAIITNVVWLKHWRGTTVSVLHNVI